MHKSERIPIVCYFCGNTFPLRIQDWRHRMGKSDNRKIFCSIDHYKLWCTERRERNMLPCFRCQALVYIPKGRLYRQNRISKMRVFCSKNCVYLWIKEHKICKITIHGRPKSYIGILCQTCKHIKFYKRHGKPRRKYCSRACTPQIKIFNRSHTIEARNKTRATYAKKHPLKLLTSTELKQRLRVSTFGKKWRILVRDRANGRCEQCGMNTSTLHSHHKVSMSELIKQSGLNTYVDLLDYAPLWDTNNGIAWCVPCHETYHNHPKKETHNKKIRI